MMDKREEKDNFSHEVIIKNLLGIHVRPAAKIADLAGKAKKNVWICSGSTRVDAGSIIDILSLGAGRGTRVVIEIESIEDIYILELIKNLINSRFGEAE